MMKFQMDHLQALICVLDEGTFDAAAERLRIRPSAVSQRIKAMEQTAGRVLVQRVSPVQCTPAGDIVLRYARQMQLLEADAVRSLDAEAGPPGRQAMALAVNADSLATWFLEALATVTAPVSFTLRREDQQHTTSLLRAGTVMAAVTSDPHPVQGCRSQRLGVMRYLAVCTPGFRDRWLAGEGDAAQPEADVAAAGEARSWAPGEAGEVAEALGHAPVVNFDRRDTLQRDFFHAVTGRVLQAPQHVVPTSADFARAIVLGMGWGLLPEQQCLAEIAAGRLVQLAPQHPVDVPLYWQRWTLQSELLDEVTDAVHATAARLLR